MDNLLAQWGSVDPPPGVSEYSSGAIGGLPIFIGNIIKTIIVGAGLFAVINLVSAGYSFMSAGGEPKKIEAAWAKIWQTLLGLAIAAGSFVLAAIFSQIIYGEAGYILQLRIFGPGP